MKRLPVALFALLLSTQLAMAGEVVERPPAAPSPEARYLFYMHGMWVELHGSGSVNPHHGAYDHAGIARALADRGFTVITEARAKGTRPPQYARKVAKQVEGLLAAGVPANRIAVIGHSKGAMITLLTSTLVGEPGVTYVAMAGCGRKGTQFRRNYAKFLDRSAAQLSGKVMSMYDEADREGGSCREAFERAGIEGREKVFHTGTGHGLFYAARDDWIGVVEAWVKGG